jgi:PAS domain S-box-containing protein
MALQVLGGKDPSSIPVNTKSDARPMFDYRQLARFKIPLDALPPGSIVTNRPASFYEINKFLVWGASGMVLFLGVVVLVLGVTINRRRRAEQKLKHHFDFMQNLLDSIPNLVFYKDTQGVYLGCNKTLEAFLGLPKEEIVGKTVFDIYPKDLADKYFAMDQELFDHPGIQVYEFEMERPDGSRRKFIFNKATFLNTEGTLGGLIGVMTDITERKAAERALRESEEKFRLVFEKAPIGIMHYDQMSVITDCNEKFAEIIGAPKEKFIGFNLIRQLRDEKMRDVVAASLHGEVVSYEGDYLSVTGGKLTPVRAIFQPIFSPEGVLSGGVAIFEDITERKQAEVERLQFSKLESLSTLAGGIAHDFNNILTAILGNISLARLDQQEGQGLADAERACLRAKALAHQLLTFAKGGAPIKELFSVAKLVTETGSFACRGSNVRCEFSLPDNLWTLWADSGQLGQVLQNLVINALQAMPAGGMIKIQGENLVVESGGDLPLNPGKYVKISIQDQGLGIPAESLPRIFDPYFTTKQTGSGLGLATAGSIIKAHQGHIAVESTLGAGTVFQVYLPAAEEKISELPKGDQGVIRGAGKILVMDDEELVRKIIGKMLGHLGYEARFAKDGDEAVKLFTQARQSGTAFDAVILDLTVPGGMGGKAALDKLLHLDPQVKAIVSSGYSEDAIMAEYAQHGFSGVIAKPYRIAELSVLLHKVIGKG